MNAQTRLSLPTPGQEGRSLPSLTSLPAALHQGVPPGGSPGVPEDARLIGREAELRALADFLSEGAAHGAARVMCGHAGSGKSALLEAAVRAATAAGTRVLRCAGIRGGKTSDMSGLLQALWPVLGGTAGRSRTPGRLDALELLLVDGAPAPGERARLSFAVLDMLDAVAAGQPLLLAVDDWDALDECSRDVLSFVARRTAGRPVALLMTSRPHPARHRSTRPAHLSGIEELPVGPLTPADAACLLRARRPGLDAQTVRELLATAAGNPLALLELPTRSDDLLPYAPPSSDRLAAAMAPGAARLPAATGDLLLMAALHPTGDLPLLLSAASQLSGERLDFAVLEPAEREDLVVFDGMRVNFAHPATAGAVVHDVAPERCRAGHAALASVMADGSVRMLWHMSQTAEGYDPELAARLEEVHGHALESCEPVLAVRLLRRAAELYVAPEDQGRCALRAAQLAQVLGLERMTRTMAHRALRRPLGPLGRQCAEVLTRTGDGATDRTADPATWPTPNAAASASASAAVTVAVSVPVSGNATVAAPTAVAAAAAVTAAAAVVAEQDNALELARITAPWIARDEARSGALLAFLDTMPDRAEDPRLLYAMATAAPERRATTVLAGVSAVRRLADLPVRDLELIGEAALLAGDPQRALDVFRQAERRHRFHDVPDQLPPVLLRQGLAHLAMGNWGQGGHALGRCAETAEEHGNVHDAVAARLLGNLVRGLRTGCPVLPPAAHELAAARQSVRSIDVILAVGTACALVEAGDFERAFASLSTLLAGPRVAAAAMFAVVPFAEAAEAVHATRKALAVLDRLEAELGAGSVPGGTARFAVARAVLADDRAAPAPEKLFEQALAEDLSGWPCLEAPLRLAHGRWLRHRRQFTDSRATLRQAAAASTMMGAEVRTARITAELRSSGERAETSTLGTLPGPTPQSLLTAQELRIAELAGRGLSNREIGELLDLSPRTIGAYLYRIFPRLGVTARAQLATVLGNFQLA